MRRANAPRPNPIIRAPINLGGLMIRYSHLLKLTALMALCAALSLSALAQKEIVVWVVIAVKKDQARATNDPSGKGLLVPVIVKMGIVL